MNIEQIKKEIGLRIKNFRKENNLTQEQFSELVNIEQASLSNIENGKTYPTFSTICSLIEKANIEPNYLFDFLYQKTNKICETNELMHILNKLPQKYKKHLLEIIKPIAKLK